MGDHHRWMIRSCLKHLTFLEQEMFELDEQILHHIEATGMQPALKLLESLPGVQQNSDAGILGEVGPDISPFPSAAHLSSWAGLCPGNRRSAGKDKGGRTTPGQPLAAGDLVAVCMGRSGEKGLLLERKILTLSRGRQETGYCRRGTYLVGAGLPSLRTGETLSGTASTLDRGTAKKAPDPTSCTQSGSARNQRRIQLPASRSSHLLLVLCASTRADQITCAEQYFPNNLFQQFDIEPVQAAGRPNVEGVFADLLYGR